MDGALGTGDNRLVRDNPPAAIQDSGVIMLCQVNRILGVQVRYGIRIALIIASLPKCDDPFDLGFNVIGNMFAFRGCKGCPG